MEILIGAVTLVIVSIGAIIWYRLHLRELEEERRRDLEWEKIREEQRERLAKSEFNGIPRTASSSPSFTDDSFDFVTTAVIASALSSGNAAQDSDERSTGSSYSGPSESWSSPSSSWSSSDSCSSYSSGSGGGGGSCGGSD